MDNILSSNNKKVSPLDAVESHYSLDIQNDEGLTDFDFMLNFNTNFRPTFPDFSHIRDRLQLVRRGEGNRR